MRKIVLCLDNFTDEQGKQQSTLYGIVDYCLYRVFRESDRPYLTMESILAYENEIRKIYNPTLRFNNNQIKLNSNCIFVDNTFVFVSQVFSAEMENLLVSTEQLPQELQDALNDEQALSNLGISGNLELDCLNSQNKISEKTIDAFGVEYAKLAKFSGAETFTHPEKFASSLFAKSLSKAKLYNIEQALKSAKKGNLNSEEWLEKDKLDTKSRDFDCACLIDYIMTYYDLAMNERSQDTLFDGCHIGDPMWKMLENIDKKYKTEDNSKSIQKGA